MTKIQLDQANPPEQYICSGNLVNEGIVGNRKLVYSAHMEEIEVKYVFIASHPVTRTFELVCSSKEGNYTKIFALAQNGEQSNKLERGIRKFSFITSMPAFPVEIHH